MYKLVVVDDEKEIRQGLAELIDWYDLGFDLIASFEDGKETIDYIGKNDVDIVLTDILMAEVSGLELAEYLYRNKPGVKVVIISGHKEFEYAKKAVEFNVEHYLLKPTDIDSIIEVFSQIREKLDRENATKIAQREIQKRYKEIVPMLEEQFFSDLLAGCLGNEEQMKKKLGSMGLAIDIHTSGCMIAEIDMSGLEQEKSRKWAHGKDRLPIAIRNFFRFTKEDFSYFPVFTGHCLKIVAVTPKIIEKGQMAAQVNLHLGEVLETVKKILGLDFYIGDKPHYGSLYELSKRREPFKINYGYGEDRGGSGFEPELYQQLVQKYKLFVSVIIEGDYDALDSLGDSYMTEIEALPLTFVQRLVSDLFAVLFNKFHEMGFKFDRTVFEKTDTRSIALLQKFEDIKELVKEGLACLAEYTAGQRKKSAEVSVSRAIDFIEKNYRKDISLEDVSNEVFLNAVYFSRLFKQQTGENFTDYLTRVRMEKAKQLVRQGKYKTYEISDMVGYSSSKYFSRVFKLYTGHAPKDYMRLAGRGDSSDG